MDISVSQLNHRLALQLPKELPLGLVFVAGTVSDLHYEEGKGNDKNGRASHAIFDLIQHEHRLRCTLSRRESNRITLFDGDLVRLGGHLAFDLQRAEYYLMARDVEVLGENLSEEVTPLDVDPRELLKDQAAFASVLAGIKRRSDVADQTTDQLPEWVQKIAPKEIQEQYAQEAEAVPPAKSTADKETTALNDEAMAFLSSAMDSEDDVELTSDMLDQWLPPGATAATHSPAQDPYTAVTEAPGTASIEADIKNFRDELDTLEPYEPVAEAEPTTEPSTHTYAPPAQQGTDWLIIVLIVAVVIFTLALIVTIFILAFQ